MPSLRWILPYRLSPHRTCTTLQVCAMALAGECRRSGQICKRNVGSCGRTLSSSKVYLVFPWRDSFHSSTKWPMLSIRHSSTFLPSLIPTLCLFSPLLCDIPIVNPRRGNLQGLAMMLVPSAHNLVQVVLTVICSRRKSRSSSQFAKLCCAADSFDFSSTSASAVGYDSITFAPNHKYTSSVGGMTAFA